MKVYNDITQQTPEWFEKKNGKLSGTRAKELMGTALAQDKIFYKILAEKLTVGDKEELEEENPMSRGNRLEPEAREIFKLKTGKRVIETGWVEDENNPHDNGYSPDGLVEDEEGTYETEDLEIKCPQGANHIKYWLENKIPDEYKWQIVHAFIVNPQLNKRYFISYNPNIPRHPFHMIVITRQDMEADINVLKVKEQQFINKINQAQTILVLNENTTFKL
jgi:exodeoxyribonuclease (lambda-induced)